ncbi:MAG: hypothetical protein Q9227_003901 [Pyrenula ochraceoflavens]
MATSAPTVKATSLPVHLVKFPADPLPSTLPPPYGNPSFAHPFTIPESLYNNALRPEIPMTIAAVYAVTVVYLNKHNEKNGKKPWAISRTKTFRYFVILHNILLAAYSAWTCLGMINALQLSVPSLRGQYGLAGVVDSFCKIHGPRGLGNAATYNPVNKAWNMANRTLHLGQGDAPDHTDIGRIWNEGLAFYGWLFYLSKFYEVLDTFVILAKGKRSSTLQTYHHSGAMMCMWAGIRYMAPPIWMFVLVNSGIHALMYTYYTLSALGFKVPMVIKRTLTTLQIAQFVVGATFAFSHLFVAYSIPVSVPYIESWSEIPAAVSSDISSVASAATATASASFGSWLKKIALRAAGDEGLAENVKNANGERLGVDAINAARELEAREEVRFRDELQMIHCTDTSGQVFAILLNCVYLAPLTALFVRFFIRSYTRRSDVQRKSTGTEVVGQSSTDAFKGLSKEIRDAVVGMHGGDSTGPSTPAETAPDPAVLKDLSNAVSTAKENIDRAMKDVKTKGEDAT